MDYSYYPWRWSIATPQVVCLFSTNRTHLFFIRFLFFSLLSIFYCGLLQRQTCQHIFSFSILICQPRLPTGSVHFLHSPAHILYSLSAVAQSFVYRCRLDWFKRILDDILLSVTWLVNLNREVSGKGGYLFMKRRKEKRRSKKKKRSRKEKKFMRQ
jgi:hypothetical protein